MSCNEGPRSRFPSWIFFDGFLRNLDWWVRKDIPPPRVAPIEVQNGEPVLDEYGNVVGGLRSPFLDVPTSTWHGSATGASFCFIAGWEEPFSEELLQQLHPTHRAYVRSVSRNVLDLVTDRVITPPDGLHLIAEAARSDVALAGGSNEEPARRPVLTCGLVESEAGRCGRAARGAGDP